MATKETGLQFLARLGSRPSLSGLEEAVFGQGPQCKDVIEIYGEEGTGKTEMLVHLIVRCILPEYWNNVHLGGHDAGVILIDSELKFSIIRLVNLLEKYILHKIGDTSEKISSDILETFIDRCLQKVHIVRCSNSTELLITLHNLENIICNDLSVSAIMIDSISSFYWIDRMNGGDTIPTQESNMKLVTKILTKLVNTYSLVLFATKATVFKKKGSESPWETSGSASSTGTLGLRQKSLLREDLDLTHAEFMCKPWQFLLSHRLILAKETTSATEAGNQEQTFILGGDCVHGNRTFQVTQAGIQL